MGTLYIEAVRSARYSPAARPSRAALARSLAGTMPGKSRVSYFYDADVGNYYYGAGHPMLAHCHCLCSQPDCVIL